MSAPGPIPTLLQLLYKDSAAAVLHSRPERLLRWAQAFDEWLAALRHPQTTKCYLRAWRYLLDQSHAPPWEITPADIERFQDGLAAAGKADSTIHNLVTPIAKFYEWCRLQGVDPACGDSFNPAAGISRPRRVPLSNACLISRGEAQALLAVFKADDSLLSRRDYAFFLCRLNLGVETRALRRLQWGQIELRDGEAWVDWNLGMPPAPLPGELWAAILDYLHASGRLGDARPGGMPPEAFIFAPQVDRFGKNITGLAREWDERACVSPRRWLQTLKIYGELLGIPAPALTMPALRHTAFARFMETSPTWRQFEFFLGKPGYERARQYTKIIKRIPGWPAGGAFEVRLPSTVRSRRPYIFTSADAYKHGLYAASLPAGQVAAILAEGITAMKEETEGLQILMRKLLEWSARVNDPAAVAELSQAYLTSSNRLKELVKTEGEGQQAGLSWQDAWAVEAIQTYYQVRDEPIPDLETIYRWYEEEQPPDPGKEQRLAEAVAGDRLVLRNLKRVALESTEPKAFAHLVEKYGAGCMHLSRLLKFTGPEPGKLCAWVEGILGKALADLRESYGLPRGEETLGPPMRRPL
jgi:integrase